MRSFIISLSKIPSSKQSADQVFQKLTEFKLNPEFFEGTYGGDADLIFLNESRSLHYTHKDEPNIKLTSSGVKGCFHSHYRLWNKCIELNEPIMIFEDDVIFYRDYSPVEFNDILVLSINYDWKITKRYRTYLEDSHNQIVALSYSLTVMPGASGYILKPHAAKILVDEYKKTYLPADLAINSNLVNIQIHSQLMGRSKTMDEKQSLTRFTGWKK